MHILADFFYGLTLPLRAARLILSRRSLLVMSIGPLLIAAAAFWLLYAEFFEGYKHAALGRLDLWLQAYLWGWLAGAIGTVLSMTVEIVFWVVAALSFGTVSNIIALPLNDFLAERSERYTEPPITLAEHQTWGEIAHGLLIDLGKAVFAGCGLVFCVILAFVPVLNLIAILLSWFLLVFQYASYCHTRRAVGTRVGIRMLLSCWPLTLGLGLACSVVLAIPLLAIFLPPVGIVSGTMLCARVWREQGAMKKGVM